MLLLCLFVLFISIVVAIIRIAISLESVDLVRHAGHQDPHRIWVDGKNPPPSSGWLVLPTAKKAISYLDQHQVSEVSLDFVLGGRSAGTGHDVLRHLCKKAVQGEAIPSRVSVHTEDRLGEVLMQTSLDELNSHRRHSKHV